MKSAPQPVRRNLHAKPASPKPCRTVSVSQSEILRMSDPAVQNVTPVSPFRMNTCKSVSKQRTLTTFRMNTYEKTGGGGRVPNPCGIPTLCLCASVANLMFSAVCRLFIVSLRSFPHSRPLFSIACSLFLQNTRVGGIQSSNYPDKRQEGTQARALFTIQVNYASTTRWRPSRSCPPLRLPCCTRRKPSGAW